MNLYGYVGNNPLNGTDPSGKCRATRLYGCTSGAEWSARSAREAEKAKKKSTHADNGDEGQHHANATASAGHFVARVFRNDRQAFEDIMRQQAPTGSTPASDVTGVYDDIVISEDGNYSGHAISATASGDKPETGEAYCAAGDVWVSCTLVGQGIIGVDSRLELNKRGEWTSISVDQFGPDKDGETIVCSVGLDNPLYCSIMIWQQPGGLRI